MIGMSVGLSTKSADINKIEENLHPFRKTKNIQKQAMNPRN